MSKFIEEAKVIENTKVIEETEAVVKSTRPVIQSMITLASAALGLVCALAWNDAIKTAMTRLLGDDKSIPGQFTYAVLATFLAVIVLLILGKMAGKIGEAMINRDATFKLKTPANLNLKIKTI